MYRMLQIEARRLRAANVWNGLDERPFPPGEYDVVVVEAGPADCRPRTASPARGSRAARCISRDPAPGGMFRRFPVYQRLISWTKPDAPFERGTREYEWYDHNSLVGDEPEHQALVPEFMDRAFDVPARPRWKRRSSSSPSAAAFAFATTASGWRRGATRRLRARDVGRRIPLPGLRVRDRRDRAVDRRRSPVSTRRRTTRRRTRRALSGQERLHRRQAELRRSSSRRACCRGRAASCSARRGRCETAMLASRRSASATSRRT